ncbi:MAG TPA: hypothetical protein VMW18_06930 [Candidatus Binatia bacterium]|nr:hypothetical protein [Candidatus Binatia bacterium]
MNKKFNEGTMKTFIAAAAIIVCGGAALSFGTRPAAADELSDTYMKYYEAIQAKTLCEDSGAPDAATMAKLSAYIAGQTKFGMTAGQSLMAIESAKAEAGKLVKANGCEDRSIQQLIGLYHSTEAAAQ